MIRFSGAFSKPKEVLTVRHWKICLKIIMRVNTNTDTSPTKMYLCHGKQVVVFYAFGGAFSSPNPSERFYKKTINLIFPRRVLWTSRKNKQRTNPVDFAGLTLTIPRDMQLFWIMLTLSVSAGYAFRCAYPWFFFLIQMFHQGQDIHFQFHSLQFQYPLIKR